MASFPGDSLSRDELPPIDKAFCEGPPPTAWRDFKHAKLRQFPRNEAAIEWLEYLGHGRDGHVFKVAIGDRNPVALKIFWRTRPPKPRLVPRTTARGKILVKNEWPIEDEFTTVALLEKIKWAAEDAFDDLERGIGFLRRVKSAADAVENLREFCDESRDGTLAPPPPPDEPVVLPDFPPLPACYGWTTVRRDEIPRLDPPVWEGMDADIDWHWAIVYEFVPGQAQDTAIAQAHLDFFHAIGFAMEAYKPDNWRGGRLVDLNDICSEFTPGWSRSQVCERNAKTWFWTLDYKNGRDQKREIVKMPFRRRAPRTVKRGDHSGDDGVAFAKASGSQTTEEKTGNLASDQDQHDT